MANLSTLKDSSSSHNAYSNNIANKILNTFETTRKNISLHLDELINPNLSLPEDFCRKPSHNSCYHAQILYKEDHHLEDLVKGK